MSLSLARVAALDASFAPRPAIARPRASRAFPIVADRVVVSRRRRRGSFAPRAAARDPVDPVVDPAAAASPPRPSRRDAVLALAALAASPLGVAPGAARADPDALAASSTSAAPASPPTPPPPPHPPPPPPSSGPLPRSDTGGTNWSVVVSGAYRRMSTEKPRRIYEQRGDCEPNCRDLQTKRVEETPLVARFGSDDGAEDVSVSIRGANTLKLTFLQIKDVREFGDVEAAAPLFVPPGATLVSADARSAPAVNPGGDDVDKGYFTYDFEFGAARVLLTAAVEQGNVYLLGCTASKERWEDAEAGFRRAARSFRVGGARRESGGEKRRRRRRGRDGRRGEGGGPPGGERDGAGGEVGGDGGRRRRPERGRRRADRRAHELQGPLPIFCSVEESEADREVESIFISRVAGLLVRCIPSESIAPLVGGRIPSHSYFYHRHPPPFLNPLRL